ncbi:MAG: cytochrome c oxidase subunit 3 family protein [Phycisphaerales bacterium]|nr:cytochrome c oxidase subunit 3 family protein [Phycisphaerales bacterium]
MSQLDANMTHDHGHDHGHDHPAHLGHHWEDSKQQFEAGKLGMWLFLSTEILLFGGLFVAYAVWRANHPEIFAYGSQFLDTFWGGLNTCVLLISSMTMAIAVTCAARGRMTAVVICLFLTLLGAGGFMVIKYIEYNHKFHEGLLPGIYFYEKPHASHMWLPLDEEGRQQEAAAALAAEKESAAFAAQTKVESEMPAAPADAEVWIKEPAATGPEGLTDNKLKIETSELRMFLPDSVVGKVENAGPLLEFAEDHSPGEEPHLAHPLQDPERPINAQKFFTIYFMMTGLHGVHVIVGGIVIAWLIYLTMRRRFSAEYYTPIDLGGLYWHIVDVIWIFLFPLFYLI